MSEYAKIILDFPRYFVVNFVFGFAILILSDLDITALALAAVALGFALSSVPWAVFFFLTTWVVLRAISPLSMIGQAIQIVAGAIRGRP